MARTKASPARMQQETMQSSISPEFKEFFVDELKDIYWAEKHLVKALPKMQKAASSEELKAAFADHLEVTKNQLLRLEQVFELLGEKTQAKKCEAMAGLVEEGNSVIAETEKGTAIRDAGLIIAAQKIEHYEIAAYGGLAQLAKTIGNEEVKSLLGETLDEEKETDELLTTLAEGSINRAAATEGMAPMEDMETEGVSAEGEYDSINLKKKTTRK